MRVLFVKGRSLPAYIFHLNQIKWIFQFRTSKIIHEFQDQI